ncbi:MAG: sn-glycerol-3-phosphate ABC transporter ATP-binding protein UgpC, partial [Candidatus Eisenbacteria bacterium]|nr:sn-glycerol-3-phosphate ABC transporter ATP-binding protein UgpC [Candidatus Eisenbacteria bacterium]
ASLEVRDKELMVLVGPSGCGKSTMLRMIAGLEEISAGDLFIGDNKVNDMAPKDRDIAMVFQSYALYPHMTVRDNMGFGLKLRKMDKEEIRQRVDDVGELLGLSDYLDRKPKALSGGQRQRVALGRAIVRDPAVFLFDEPLSNLDASLRVQMRTEINNLHQRLQATMVYVTHDQVEAMTMADRIAVLKDGVLQQVAPPLELYDHPVNQFVASFIGSPAMNFIAGEFDGRHFAAGGFKVDLGEVFSGLAHRGPVTLGVRPEDLVLGEAGSGSIPIDATLVEPMGNEVFLHGMFAGEQVLARLAPAPIPQAGQQYHLVPAAVKCHLFDAQTGASLSVSSEPLEV